MFTGIIESVGRVAAVETRGGDVRLRIEAGTLPLDDVAVGDSIAVSGVCLTAVAVTASGFSADVSTETRARSCLAQVTVGTVVNLEKALLPTTRLGGHLVSGHVDGIGEVVGRQRDGRSVRMRVRAPSELARYIAAKGSICLDGVSLTVNEVAGAEFGVNIVPHTLESTTLAAFAPGRRVNLEVDLIARYLERLLSGAEPAADYGTGLTRELLAHYGFSGA